MGLTNFEKKVLKDVSKKKCWEHVKWFAEKGEKLSGTPINEKSVDYILDTLKRLGVKATAPKFDAWLGFPNNKDCKLTVLEPEKRALKCVTLAQSYSTSPEGIEGELIYVKGGSLKDYQDINARNKITLVEFSKPPARPWKNYVAGILKGAIGQIVISYTSPEEVINKGTVKSVWGNPTPETIQDIGGIPIINISAKNGMYLKNLLEKNKVKVRLHSFSESARAWRRVRETHTNSSTYGGSLKHNP
jgi:hypothetical protein